MRKRIHLCLSLLLLTVSGCDSASDQPPNQSMEPAPISQVPTTALKTNEGKGVERAIASGRIVARIGGQPVTLKEIDDIIQLRLFDLEWRKYELRKAVLNQKTDEHIKTLGSNKNELAEIYLEPPAPPRLKILIDQRPVKGHRNANIQLFIFCSYQSSHCAKLQPVLNALETRYKGFINLRFYDYPQEFHRYALAAANAVHCATEFGRTWDYHSAIYSDISQLTRERYLIIAKQLGLDEAAFSSCLSELRYKDLIDADIKLARKLGLGNVPVVFINGLYVKGPQTTAGFSYYIDKELARISHAQPELSRLPIRLLATSVSSIPDDSTAIIEFVDSGDIQTFRTGSQLTNTLVLIAIEESRVLVNNQGQLEIISLKNGDNVQAALKDIAAAEIDVTQSASSSESSHSQESEQNYRELKPTGNMTLSRQWVQDQLSRKEELESYFYAAEHEVEGVHLLKLKHVDEHPFYKTLGLRSGDVVLRVNEQFVHDAHNALWENLQNKDRVKMLIMRKGFPVRYDYTVK